MSNKLTEREEEVLQLSTQGLTAKSVGERLGITQWTVQTHRRNIYKKLGAKRIVNAAVTHYNLSAGPKLRPPDFAGKLTLTEAKVVAGIASGLTAKEVASKLRIETKTVQNHCNDVIAATQSKNMVHAIAKLSGYEPEVKL